MSKVSKVCALCDLDHPRRAVALCPLCGRYVCDQHARPRGGGTGQLICAACFEASSPPILVPKQVKTNRNGRFLRRLPWFPLVLFPGILIFMLLEFVTASNYWAYFLTIVFAGPLLFAIWSIGFFVHLILAALQLLKGVRSGQYDLKRTERSAIALIPFTIVCLGFLGLSTFKLLRFPDHQLYDLLHGPAYGKAVIEKETVFTRQGVNRYIITQGTRYHVPDRSWFRTLETGQEIEFLYSPRTLYAFPLQTNKEAK